MNQTLISHEKLELFAEHYLCVGGFDEEESAVTAKSLVKSNLMGYDSHGVIRVIEYVNALKLAEVKSGVELLLLKESASHLVCDGQCGLGQVQMPRLLDRLVKKAQSQPTVTGTLKNCGHIGRLGEWVEFIAERGIAGLVAVNDNGAFLVVAPPGGKSPCTSTNPIALGMPLLSGQKYFTIDMSTSSVAMGKLKLAHLAREPCELGWIQDAEGNPTTNPSVIFQEPSGSILPMAGYKGFALSMMVDCLVAGLSGGSTPPPSPDQLPLNNVVVTLWNPEHFTSLQYMSDQADRYFQFLRGIPPIDKGSPIRLPGDQSRKTYGDRKARGIPIEHGALSKLQEEAKKLGMALEL